MKYLINLLVIIILSVYSSSCGPDDPLDDCKRNYVFSVPVTLSPALDTFGVGDTISISSVFSYNMVDQNTEEIFDMSEFPFNTDIGFARADSNPASCGNTLVTFIKGQGELTLVPLTGGCISPQVEYENEDGQLLFSCQVVLNTPGLFIFGSESFNPDQVFPEIKEGCKTDSVQIHYALTPIGGDTNFELLQYSIDPQKKNITKDIFDAFGTFVFFVEE